MRPLVFALLALLAPGWDTAHAHGGGLDKHGCHNNRKTGDYHCHRGPAAPAPNANDRLDPSLLDAGRKATVSGAFRNCAEARAAGVAPVRRGETGYGSHLDRDGDGVGCEPYQGR